MASSTNGKRPHKTTEEVATELRATLQRQLGDERAEAVLRDPTALERVLEDDEEAASVAAILLRAWNELPQEEPEPQRRRFAGFRRGLQLAMLAAVAVWAVSLLRRVREGEGT